MPDLSIESLDPSSPYVLLLIVLGAMIQDDLTCLTVGSLVAAGRLAAVPALAACLLGAFLGDLSWFLSARLLGPALLERRPASFFVTATKLERVRDLFDRLGPWALFASRFLPLVRTPLQVSSGLLLRSTLPGCGLLLVAGVLYVGLVGGGSALLGKTDVAQDLYHRFGNWSLLAVPLAAWLVLQVGRRLLRGHQKLPDQSGPTAEDHQAKPEPEQVDGC